MKLPALTLACAGAICAQPVCNAESTGLVTDGMGITRAAGYTCPTDIGVGKIIGADAFGRGGFMQRQFYLIVQHSNLDKATLTFSRTLPIMKWTGSTDPLLFEDLKPGKWYLVTYRGADHFIHPLTWYAIGPLGHAMVAWTCCPITIDTGETLYMRLARFQLADGTYAGPWWFLVPAPPNYEPKEPQWTRVQ